MTDTKNHIAGIAGSLEGRVFTPNSTAEITEAVELAFDYRGDVTLTLRSGESVTGIFTSTCGRPFLSGLFRNRPMLSAFRIEYRHDCLHRKYGKRKIIEPRCQSQRQQKPVKSSRVQTISEATHSLIVKNKIAFLRQRNHPLSLTRCVCVISLNLV